MESVTYKEDKLKLPQFTKRVIAVKPTMFNFNPETAKDNKFQSPSKNSPEAVTKKALEEHEQYVKNMTEAGVEVKVYTQECPEAVDAIFPDWFTIQRCDNIPGGVLTVFPMKNPSRRKEKSPTMIDDLKKTCEHFIDLSYLEKEDLYLEGKGAVIYDLRNNKIYVCLSERAKMKAVEIYIEQLNKISLKPWTLITFSGKDRKGDTIYHTDCMLQLLTHHALLSGSSLNEEEKKKVLDELTNPEKNLIPYSVIELSFDEVEHMCCNILNVLSSKNEKVLLMSQQAYDNYSKEHRDLLSKHYKLVHTDVSTVEIQGGGSTRCMLAEYF